MTLFKITSELFKLSSTIDSIINNSHKTEGIPNCPSCFIVSNRIKKLNVRDSNGVHGDLLLPPCLFSVIKNSKRNIFSFKVGALKN